MPKIRVPKSYFYLFMNLSGTRFTLYPDIAMLGGAHATWASRRRSPKEHYQVFFSKVFLKREVLFVLRSWGLCPRRAGNPRL